MPLLDRTYQHIHLVLPFPPEAACPLRGILYLLPPIVALSVSSLSLFLLSFAHPPPTILLYDSHFCPTLSPASKGLEVGVGVGYALKRQAAALPLPVLALRAEPAPLFFPPQTTPGPMRHSSYPLVGAPNLTFSGRERPTVAPRLKDPLHSVIQPLPTHPPLTTAKAPHHHHHYPPTPGVIFPSYSIPHPSSPQPTPPLTQPHPPKPIATKIVRSPYPRSRPTSRHGHTGWEMRPTQLSAALCGPHSFGSRRLPAAPPPPPGDVAPPGGYKAELGKTTPYLVRPEHLSRYTQSSQGQRREQPSEPLPGLKSC